MIIKIIIIIILIMTVIWQNSYSALSYSGFLEVVVLPRKGK